MVHGDRYDYSKVEYINAITKVCIICPNHGEFWQSPYAHLNGSGCKKCAIEYTARKNTKSFDFFLRNAHLKHGNKYEYDENTYVNSHTKMRIICPDHGEFWQQPCNHILGDECPICAKNKRIKNSTLGKEEFIKRAKEIHGDKYNYSKVDYINLEVPVCIICPNHGEFWQKPSIHLNGSGCIKCSKSIWKSKGEDEIVAFIKTILPDVQIELHNKTILNGKEIDIFIPRLNIGIEYDGLIWHSELIRNNKNYHLNKGNNIAVDPQKLSPI